MTTRDIFTLDLGLTPPWRVAAQHLDQERHPNELWLEVSAAPDAVFPCPKCGHPAKAHDWKETTWQHLNFFQHHCFIKARVPRVTCPEHGVLRVHVPWARPDSGFTVPFEQAALTLVREMPVAAAARLIGVTDKRLWRVIEFYVGRTLDRLDLRSVAAVGLDETATKRGHTYVTVFIDLDRKDKPALCVTPGKGKGTLARFRVFLERHGGNATRIVEVVRDTSKAFLAAVAETFEKATVTIDWFHVVRLFTKAVDQVRRSEAKHRTRPKGARWAALKGNETLTQAQACALAELETGGFAAAVA